MTTYEFIDTVINQYSLFKNTDIETVIDTFNKNGIFTFLEK